MSGVVKVRRDGPRGWHLIDRAKYDLDPSQYELVDPLPEELRVGRGPRGAWYVKRGKEFVSGPYESEDAAVAAMDGVVA